MSLRKSKITIALAGNPNSGKTTIFNKITGERQHVGNYAGVTVEKEDGECQHNGVDIHVVDLPGTYSLTAFSLEELIARHFIIDDKPDVIVDILDASNIERNLYLATQLMELNIPLVLVLNMSDTAKLHGIEFDLKLLSELLGAPIVTTIGHKGKGIDEILDAVISVAEGKTGAHGIKMNLGRDIEKQINNIQALIESENKLVEKYSPRWLAIKLLENDEEIHQEDWSDDILAATEKGAKRIEAVLGDSPEIIIADRRYGVISGACQEAVRLTVEARHTYSDKIDEVLTNRILGLPIFFVMMYIVFQLTFAFGEIPVGWIETCFAFLGNSISYLWPNGSDSLLLSMLVDGIIGGVGGVIVFVPNIFLLFLAIAILEDTGYMARAAFNMDRLMHKIGLHGKSFIPMLVGFGCSVPAIMATRTLENRKDRLITMLIVPLMSCGARLPIYTLFIPAFFPQAWQAPVLWLIYLIGILVAVVLAKLLRVLVFKGESSAFVMELPPYRIPTLKGVLVHVWERTWLYLRKAGTIILGISIVMWALSTFPQKTVYDFDHDAISEQATNDYFSAVKSLNPLIDLSSESTVLVDAIRAEYDMSQEQQSYHPFEDGFKLAYQKQNETIEQLIQSEEGKPLENFIKIRKKISSIRYNFETSIENNELEKDSTQYLLLDQDKDHALDAIEKSNPAIYQTVVKYLDDIKYPYDEKIAKIDQAIHSEEMTYSIAGRIGKGIEPVLKPLGFNWKIGTALIGAFAAKEVFVAQLGIVYSLGETNEQSNALRKKLRKDFTPLAAFCIMIFCLISAPCMATIAITRQESGSWKWAMLQLGGLTLVAYILTLVIYQSGLLLGIGI